MAWTAAKIFDESPYEHLVPNEEHRVLLIGAQRRAATAAELATMIKQHKVVLEDKHALPAATIIGNCGVPTVDREKLQAVAEQVEAGLQATRFALASGVAADIRAAAKLIADFDGSIGCDPDRTITAPAAGKVGPHRLFGGNGVKGLDLAFVSAHKHELATAVEAKAFEAERNWAESIKAAATVPEDLRLTAVADLRTAAAKEVVALAQKEIEAAEETMRGADDGAGADAKEAYLGALSRLLAVQSGVADHGLSIAKDDQDAVQAKVAVGKDFYANVEPCAATLSLFT